MESSLPFPDRDPDATWKVRERYWRGKLGRLRLGVEPLEEQLARYRRVTWVLTAVPAGVALMFVGLFTAFQRPDVGGILAFVLLLPIVVFAWIDYGLLGSAARPGTARASGAPGTDRRTPRGEPRVRPGCRSSLPGGRDRSRGAPRRGRRRRPRRDRRRRVAGSSIHSSASATPASSSALSRLRAVWSRRLMVPIGASSRSAISTSDWPWM